MLNSMDVFDTKFHGRQIDIIKVASLLIFYFLN